MPVAIAPMATQAMAHPDGEAAMARAAASAGVAAAVTATARVKNAASGSSATLGGGGPARSRESGDGMRKAGVRTTRAGRTRTQKHFRWFLVLQPPAGGGFSTISSNV